MDGGADRVDHSSQFHLAALIMAGEGIEDFQEDPTSHVDGGTSLVFEYLLKAQALSVAEQFPADAGGAADAVEWMTGAASVPAAVRLDAVAAQAQLHSCEGDDRERSVTAPQVLRLQRILVTEAVHRDHLDTLPIS